MTLLGRARPRITMQRHGYGVPRAGAPCRILKCVKGCVNDSDLLGVEFSESGEGYSGQCPMKEVESTDVVLAEGAAESNAESVHNLTGGEERPSGFQIGGRHPSRGLGVEHVALMRAEGLFGISIVDDVATPETGRFHVTILRDSDG